MKKVLALIVVLALALTFAVGCTPKHTVSGTLTVGTPEMNGNFIWGFGNNSYDKYVKDLLGTSHYYDLYNATRGGEIVLNNVVVKGTPTVEEDADGNKTYTFELHKDLKWNDGSKLTAQDYVTSVLFRASKAWADAKGVESVGDGLMGYDAYKEGETDVFVGVQLLSEYSFSLTIDAAELPYFYEYAYVAISPVCAATWIPEGSIESTEAGSKIVGVDLDACAENIATNELKAPTVTCGPYSFVSFENQTCTLKYNEYFKGDADGNKPNFEYVVVKAVPQETDVDMVISGEIDMVTGVVEGDKIEAAKAAETTLTNSYKRNGYGLLAFHCDWGVTADRNVRWAVASLIDRSEVLDYVLGGYGGTVDGDYGLAQWMYQERQAELAEALTPIAFNIAIANDYLDQTEWKYEADGTTPFDASKANADGTYLRYNAAGEPLVIEHLGSDGNQVTDALELQLTGNAPLAGVTIHITKGDFDMLLDNYYYGFDKGEDRFFNTFNLATGFDKVYDPYYGSYHSDFAGTENNSNQIVDAELDRLIIEMQRIEPGDTEAYADKWVEFQTRFNYLLPNVPLYSNEYFDVFKADLVGVATTPFLTWAETICDISRAA